MTESVKLYGFSQFVTIIWKTVIFEVVLKLQKTFSEKIVFKNSNSSFVSFRIYNLFNTLLYFSI